MFRKKQRDVAFRLILLDSLALSAAWFLAVAIRHHDGITPEYVPVYTWTLAVWLGAIFVTFRSLGLHEGRLRGPREATEVIKGFVLALFAFMAFSFFYRGFSYSRLALWYFLFLGPFLLLMLRGLHHRYFDARGQPVRVLVVGAGKTAESVTREIGRLQGLGYVLAGQVPDTGHLENLLASSPVEEVIVAVSDLSVESVKEAVELSRRHKVTLKIVPTFYELALNRMEWEDLNGIPVLSCSSVDEQTIVMSRMKRAIDVMLSGLGLIVIAPGLLFVAALIKLTSPGPALYLQRRVGQGGREFDFYKLRTMRVDAPDSIHRDFVQGWIRPPEGTDPGVFKMTQDDRVTPIGRFLRKFSIDELPQLYNVLIGDMSLVGPRPPLAYEVEMYTDWHRRRLAVRPGITGLWQVSGRNRLSFQEMVTLDLDYIQNWNLLLDFKLLLRTIPVVLCWWEAF